MRTFPNSAKIAAVFLFLTLPGEPGVAAGQTRPSDHRVVNLHVTGQKHFTEQQILAASGLRNDEPFSDDALNAATERLAKTGAFEQVRFRYRFNGPYADVEFQIKEAGRFHRCILGNFIWGDPQDLEAWIRGDVPLYDGQAPETGGMLDEIAASLERYLKSKGVKGKVEQMRSAALRDGDWDYEFLVKGPHIQVREVVFQGRQAIEEGELQREAKQLAGREYSLADSLMFGRSTIVPLYRNRGYLRMNLEDPLIEVQEHAEGSNDYALRITYRLTEGILYHWTRVEWSGNNVFSAGELDRLVKLKPGEAAGEKKIKESWEAIAGGYASKGYIRAKLTVEPVYDDPGATVHFRVAIAEGAQYRMGELEVDGATPALEKQLRKKWSLRSGEVFNGEQLKEYMKTAFRIEGYGAAGRPFIIEVETHRNEENLTVDVLLHVR